MADDETPGDYIEQRQDIHDCFFLVGTQKKERISTLRCFLANYSSYFRAMLLETEMKEKNSKEDIVIPDHEPDVFRLMLSYVYGHHDIKFKDVDQAMRFHILVDKCLMPKLKKISTKYLVKNCTSKLCKVLECAVMLEIKEMEPRAKSERISTLRCFLANYSSYFRAMLLETEMKEKNSKEDIVIPDHEPDVFRLMLSYVYGHHDIKFKDVDQAMRFHILVDKCLMPKLKKISTKYLVKNCTSKLCKVLECAVMLEIKEMEPRAKSIIEDDTKALLSSPDFLNANPAIVEFIVKQDGLNVTEVELWRALVKWAKRQCGNTREGRVLRRELNSFIEHIQFLKMTLKEFAEEVVITAILEPTEINTIFVNMATGKGNKITEAPSKPRHRYLLPEHVATFQTALNTNTYNRNNWSCDYVISQIKPRRLRITSIELAETVQQERTNMLVHPNSNTAESGKCVITLYSSSSYGHTVSITAYRRNNQWQPSPTLDLELSDGWIVEAGSRGYELTVKYNRDISGYYNQHHYNLGAVVGIQSTKQEVVGVCQVSLEGSTFQDQHQRMLSIIKSITFSVVDS